MMLDFGYRWHDWHDALLMLERVEDCDIFFAEATLQHDDLEGHARLASVRRSESAARSPRPRASSQRMADERAGRRAAAQHRARRRLHRNPPHRRPVRTHTAREVVPHGWKTGITAAAGRHFQAATADSPDFEFLSPLLWDSPIRTRLVHPEPTIEDGRMPLPVGPGLGIELDLDAVEHFRVATGCRDDRSPGAGGGGPAHPLPVRGLALRRLDRLRGPVGRLRPAWRCALRGLRARRREGLDPAREALRASSTTRRPATPSASSTSGRGDEALLAAAQELAALPERAPHGGGSVRRVRASAAAASRTAAERCRPTRARCSTIRAPASSSTACTSMRRSSRTSAALSGSLALVDAGAEQALALTRLLQQPDGSFAHFYLERTGRTYGHGWGRGQGWALLGLLDVLERLAAGAPGAAHARRGTAAARRMRSPRASSRTATGARRSTTPASFHEASTAFFVAAGFTRAIRLGLIGPVLEPVAARAFGAGLAAVAPDGTIAGISAALWACTAISHYPPRSVGFQVPWGQGPFLVAANERANATALT